MSWLARKFNISVQSQLLTFVSSPEAGLAQLLAEVDRFSRTADPEWAHWSPDCRRAWARQALEIATSAGWALDPKIRDWLTAVAAAPRNRMVP